MPSYNPKREKNCFDPSSRDSYKLSRTKLENFVRCPRCFYIDRRLGIEAPHGPAFTLNIAVDELLKREFDGFRGRGVRHPLMEKHGVDAVPFQHAKLEEWRNNKKGVQYLHTATNFLMMGAVDDLWINPQSELHIVDYKATSKDGEVTLDDEWKDSYKRQAEIYQWLFRKNGFKVSTRAYFVYCNGNKTLPAFDGALQFLMDILPYDGNDSWVDQAITDAHKCLMSNSPPQPTEKCDFCLYSQAILGINRR